MPRLLAGFPEPLAAYARAALERHGVSFADEDARTLAKEVSLEALGATKWAGERLILQVATETLHERIETIGKLLGALQAA